MREALRDDSDHQLKFGGTILQRCADCLEDELAGPVGRDLKSMGSIEIHKKGSGHTLDIAPPVDLSTDYYITI